GDVKPGNVIVDRGERAVLIDLGVAADLRAGRTLGGGTPPYMAPEVGVRRVDHRVDLFATGILLVEVLSGSMVIDLGDCARRAAAMPPALADVVRIATSSDPDARYRHARAMRDALRSASSQLRADGVDERIRLARTVRCADSSPVTVPSRGSKPRA